MSTAPVHLVRNLTHITACGRYIGSVTLVHSADWQVTTCKQCLGTTEFKNERNHNARTEGVMPKQDTVGIPTAEETPKPTPLVHLAYATDDIQAVCLPMMDRSPTGFSTMDLDAVTCEWCKTSLEFSARLAQRDAIAAGHEPDDDPIYESDLDNENEAFEAARRTDSGIDEEPADPWAGWDKAHSEDMRGTGVVRDHDAPWRPYPQQGVWTHDCDRCFYLGTHEGHDLYFCRQSTNKGTVIARWGNAGGEYKSGIWSAKQEPLLALALVRALHRGLVTSDDIKEI